MNANVSTASIEQTIQNNYLLAVAAAQSGPAGDDIRRFLSEGYEVAGSGNHACVLVKGDRAARFGVDHDGGRYFAAWVMQQQTPHPHLPKVYDVEEYRGTDLYRVEMERLEPIPAENWSDPRLNAADEGLQAGVVSGWRNPYLREIAEDAKAVHDAFPDEEFAYDLTPNNVMRRPSTGEFVISDPLGGSVFEHPDLGRYAA